jgi:release factor glutamine methyltransferase
LNAELLLSEVLNCKRLELYTNFEKPLKEEEIQKFREYLLRRTKGEPVQYITGKAYFYGFEFIVTPDVLIPRPETELLVEEVIDSFEKNESLKIADLCSGSGNIGITLAKFFPNSEVDCIDVSEKAIEIGRLNAEKLDAENVSFYKIDILNDELPQKIYDVIVSNPPYIPVERKNELQREVRLYEPEIALFVNDELKFYRRIMELSERFLKVNGKIFFEIDNEIAHKVYDLMKGKNFSSISIKKDLAKLNRIISGVKEK